MNPFTALLRFIEDKTGSLRFGIVSPTTPVGDLRYVTVAESNRKLRDDFKRVAQDLNNAMRTVSDYGKDN